MAGLEILGFPHSNFVWACRICAEEKGIPYTLVPTAPHTPEVLAINPTGRIPALRHGSVTLFETRAIIGYLDQGFPGAPLIPRLMPEAAQCEQWLSLVATTIDRECMRNFVVQYAFPSGPGKTVDMAKVTAALPMVRRQMEYLAPAVACGTLLPQGFTAADALLVPILYWLRNWPEGAAAMAAQPAVAAYLERMMARPSIAATEPPPPKKRD